MQKHQLTAIPTAVLLQPVALYADQYHSVDANKMIGSRASHGRRMIKVVATAYTHTGKPCKDGSWPKVGVIATDPTVIPLGTRVYVEGYGPAIAGDTGTDIQGNRTDEFYETEAQCVRFGRQPVIV